MSTLNINVDIGPDAVDNTELANMGTNTLKGRVAAGTGDPQDLTADQASTVLDTATDPFLRTSAAGGVSDGDKGDIVVSGSGATWLIDTAVKSTGGNGAADATKLAVFGANGQGKFSSDGGLAPALTLDTTALGASGLLITTVNALAVGITGAGGDGINVSVTGDHNAIYAQNSSTTEPPLHVQSQDGTNAAPIAHLHNVGNQGLVILNDGGSSYTSPTGAQTTRVNTLPSLVGNALRVLRANAGETDVEFAAASVGTVTSVDVSGGATGLTTSGGPVTGSGTITLAGTLDVDNGGTGATSASAARTSLAAAPNTATYIVQTDSSELSADQALSSLSTGLVKVTTGTGVLSAAAAGTDYLAPAAIGVTVQAFDADLTTWAGITPGANVGTFLATPSSANLAAALTDEVGTGLVLLGQSPGSQSLAVVPTITAGGAPATPTNTYNWSQIGHLVTYQFTLTYASAGTTVTAVNIALPSDMPNPFEQSGLTAASDNLYPLTMRATNGDSGAATAANSGSLRRNAADNGYEFNSAIASGTYSNFFIFGTYYTA